MNMYMGLRKRVIITKMQNATHRILTWPLGCCVRCPSRLGGKHHYRSYPLRPLLPESLQTLSQSPTTLAAAVVAAATAAAAAAPLLDRPPQTPCIFQGLVHALPGRSQWVCRIPNDNHPPTPKPLRCHSACVAGIHPMLYYTGSRGGSDKRCQGGPHSLKGVKAACLGCSPCCCLLAAVPLSLEGCVAFCHLTVSDNCSTASGPNCCHWPLRDVGAKCGTVRSRGCCRAGVTAGGVVRRAAAGHCEICCLAAAAGAVGIELPPDGR